MDDRQIIELYNQRDENAIKETSDKYGNYCFSIANNILVCKQDSEECVNDACLGVWNTVPPATPNPLLTYVLRIVRNLSLSRYRYNKATKRNGHYNLSLEEIADCVPSDKTVDEEIEVKELTDALNAWLKTLGEENRYIFIRRYWYMDEVKFISQSLSLSDAAVYLRLERMKKNLTKYLSERSFLI